MTERTIRHLAKELAGKFYEQKRSDRFRSKDSLTRARRLVQHPDGRHEEVIVVVPFFQAYPDARTFVKAHWPLFVEPARQCMVTMLALKGVHDNMKRGIYDALLEDREKQLAAEARGAQVSLIQARVLNHGEA